MTKKSPPTPALSTEDPKALRVEQGPKETRADTLAHTSLRPTVQAALTLLEYNKGIGEMSINTLVDDLGKQCELASNGDLKRTEALLIAQAHTLDAIFNNFARRAALNAGEYMNACEVYLRLALKAQSQCRTTLETLATIKNPQPLAFVRQANISHGPQQVNNESFQASTRAGAREKDSIMQNELLEQTNGERLEPGTASGTGSGDTQLETVGALNGAADRRR